MNFARVIGLALFLLAFPSYADSSADAKECEKTKQKIRELQAKMRHGYSAAQGIRYEERLRKLKDKRYKVCR